MADEILRVISKLFTHTNRLQDIELYICALVTKRGEAHNSISECNGQTAEKWVLATANSSTARLGEVEEIYETSDDQASYELVPADRDVVSAD